ncbi:MAG: DUF4340 domain-containing protein [Planctomycetia bacterium]
MKLRGLLVLVALLAGLWVAWRLVEGEERRVEADLDRALVEGVHEADVVGVRLESVERDYIAEFRRTADGSGWGMTSPWDARADAGLVSSLVSVCLSRRGVVVADADLSGLELDPPRHEVRLRLADGEERRVRVGRVDLDAQRVWAWSEGRAMLVLRDLETLTDRMLDEWLSRNLTDLDSRQVVRVERQGRHASGGVEADLALDAGLSGGEWRLQSPWRARADPQAIELLAQLAAGLRVEHFVDLGVRTRAELGLDPPRFSLVATTLRDERARLSFGGDLEGRLLVASDQRPWSGLAEPEVVELATAPALEFVDLVAWRVPRAQVDELVVERQGERTELRRAAAGWSVAQGRAREGYAEAFHPAEESRVQALLALFEGLRFSSMRPGLELEARATDGGAWLGGRGARFGVEFGPEWSEPGATPLLRARREGEDLVALFDPRFALELERATKNLWSLAILAVDEVRLRALVLLVDGRERRYERGRKGRWTLAGHDTEAVELFEVLDPVLFLRATEHVGDAEGRSPLAQGVEVRLLGEGEVVASFVAGLDQDGRAAVDCAGRRSLLRETELPARLRAIALR